MVKWRHEPKIGTRAKRGNPVLGLPERIRATLFDLDGVLTDTASVHKKAWKSMFDDFLRAQAERTRTQFTPF
ncbi:MAG TPA: hypothetical protein VGA66_00555, partial [Mycobacterium sp.]